MTKTIRHYQITEEIGQGAMGKVYLARDTLLERRVAIKEIFISKTKTECDDETVKRFYREAKAAASLSHPNIVTIHAIEEIDGSPYIVMEYIEGKTLRQIMNQGQMDTELIIGVLEQICKGVGHAHERGIVHRDIKPDNIFIQTNGNVKIVDFGIARIADSTMVTKTGMLLGTPAYMSPEQVRGEPVDRRADIYSIGLLAYEMLTGSAPFTSDDIFASMYRIVNEDLPPLHQSRPDISPYVSGVIRKAASKRKEERFDCAELFAKDLKEAFSSGKTIAVPSEQVQGTIKQPPIESQHAPHLMQPVVATPKQQYATTPRQPQGELQLPYKVRRMKPVRPQWEAETKRTLSGKTAKVLIAIGALLVIGITLFAIFLITGDNRKTTYDPATGKDEKKTVSEKGYKGHELKLAAINGDTEEIALLIAEGADIEARDYMNSTPLHFAAGLKNADAAELLIEAGADVNAINDKRTAPLHLAAHWEYTETAKLLIDSGADVNVRDDEGWAPLHFASSLGHKEMARLLVESGADVNARNDYRETPLRLAISLGHTETAELLKMHDAIE